nr:hypothetical protein B0A51_12188 [Rachicladosporium sp. CCFEE 5018]
MPAYHLGWIYLAALRQRVRYDPTEQNFVTESGQRLSVQLAQQLRAHEAAGLSEGKGKDNVRVQEIENSEEEAEDDDDDDEDGPDSHSPVRDLNSRTGLVPRTLSRQPDSKSRQSTGNAYSGAHADLSTRFGRMNIKVGDNSVFAPQYVSIVAPLNPDVGNQSGNRPNNSQRDSNKGGRGKGGGGRRQFEGHDEL